MSEFTHQRHKPPLELVAPRELVLVCPAFRSNVNFARIVRAAGCCGVRKIICAGTGRLDTEVSRIDESQIEIEVHRTLLPVLKKLKAASFTLVGLEQTTNSALLFDYPFPRRTALVVGNERSGITDDVLAGLDAVVEIPVYGLPFAHNVATATAIALYEFCRQYPRG